MAHLTDQQLLTNLRRASNALGKSTTWSNTNLPVSVENDFLYEMYVLFSLMLDLNSVSEYEIRYIAGAGQLANCFPRKPAPKRDRPRFHVLDRRTGDEIFQVCAGTQIEDINGDNRAPDISIQISTASETPTYIDVSVIWDAKYRKNRNKRITHSEFSQFAHWVDVLKLRNKPIVFILNNFTNMTGHCLITNGQHSTELDAELIRLNIKEVASFYPKLSPVVKP